MSVDVYGQWFAGKFWDGLGMKYIAWLLFALFAVSAAPSRLLGQSAFLPSNSALPTTLASGDTGSDDSVLTIRKRVDEVNVLFIATDKHGKFVRNLNQDDFAILDDHKP